MKNKIKFLILAIFALPSISLALNASISAVETVSNATLGVNDQNASLNLTTTKAVEVKAVRTFFVDGLPDDSESVTVGTCVITFTTTAGSTVDELNCSDNAATIDLDTGAGDIARSANDLGGILRTLTNVSDTNHGTLAISGSNSVVTFTEVGTVTSASTISLSDGTGGNIGLFAPVTGVIGIAQVSTLNITGTVETGDIFGVSIPTVGTVSYTVTSGDTTTNDIATGLNAAIQASAGYSSQDFTTSVVSNTVVFTGKNFTTGFSVTGVFPTNRAAASQVVVFTPSNLDNTWDIEVTINGTKYTRRHNGGDTIKTTVEALQVLLDANTSISCTEDDTSVTCTANVAGTGFSYSANINGVNTTSGGYVTYGCGDQNASNYNYFVRHNASLCVYNTLPVITNTTVEKETTQTISNISSVFTKILIRKGNRGEEVSLLQTLLNNQIEAKLNLDGIFGPLTEKAVRLFQTNKGIKVDGIVGPQTKGALGVN